MKYKIVNDELRERFVLHSFTISDCEDPAVYAAEPIYQWQQTPAGKFCMEKATDLTHHMHMDASLLGYRVVVTGYLTPKQATFWALKRG